MPAPPEPAPQQAPWPDWHDRDVIVVGAGPSAAKVDLAHYRKGRLVVVINKSQELVPDADLWYCCDFRMWQSVKGGGDFAGLKVSQDRMCANRPAWNIRLVNTEPRGDDMLFGETGRIGWGGNGGFQAVNLVAQLGARRIYLAGFDMTLDNGAHWHEPHEGFPPAKIADVARHRRAMEAAAPALRAHGVDVISISPGSALRAFYRPLAIDGVRINWEEKDKIR